MADLFIGIDGGGSRSTAVVVDSEGVERARCAGDAALVVATDPAAGVDALAGLVAAALRAAGDAPPAAGLCCALAGAGRPAERRVLGAELARLGLARTVRIATDAEAALEDALGNGAGILLLSGTGSIAWGRAEDGRSARAGGWGALLGDDGSGYALGLAALRAVARMHDGREPIGPLREAVLAHTRVTGPEALVGWAAAAGKRDIAALAPVIAGAARAADARAGTLVAGAVADLVAHLPPLLERLGPWAEPPPLGLAGGLLAPGRPLRDPVLDAVRRAGIRVRPLVRLVDAARGAAALARA